MARAGVDALLLSLGADLPWLCGYAAMPLERLTMLIVPAADSGMGATLVVPELEAPRVAPLPEVFSIRPWAEAADAVSIVASVLAASLKRTKAPVLAIGDRTWASFVLRLQEAFPSAGWRPASGVLAPLRAVKDEGEVEALAQAAAAADRVAAALLAGEIALIGRPEREVSAEITRRLLEEGHERVNFAIVGSGPNSASPHHEPGARAISVTKPWSATSAVRWLVTARISPGPSSLGRRRPSWPTSTRLWRRPKRPGPWRPVSATPVAMWTRLLVT